RQRTPPRGGRLHAGLAQPRGVEPGPVLRPHRADRRGGPGDGPGPAPPGPPGARSAHGGRSRGEGDPARPPAAAPFAGLKESTSGTTTNVFITFLVGGGVLLSGIAWIVDRVASTTST